MNPAGAGTTDAKRDLMLHCDALRTFHTNDADATKFVAVRWYGWHRSKDLSGLVAPVPKSHSLWDAAGGALGENYGLYKDVVATPGDWLVVATDTLPDHSTLVQRYVVKDADMRDLAVDVPPGLVLSNHVKALEVAATAGLLGPGTSDTARAKSLKQIEAYLASGVWPCGV